MSHPFDRYAGWTDLEKLKDFSFRPLRKSMRVNTLKCTVEEFLRWANEKKWMIEPISWCAEGYFIDRPVTGPGGQPREALGKDMLHLLGHTYMQEAASMLPVELLEARPGLKILDMSAAPGSKTTQIAAKLRGTGVVVANDVQEKRLWTLKTALHRLGVTNVLVTKKVGQWFSKQMTERFDAVLCDAPCTAQGTSRKDSDALQYCSLENIGKMAKLQRELLESAVHACKVGGRIVYSTCTLTPEENEEVVRSILQKFPDQLEAINPLGTQLMQAVEDSLLIQKELGFERTFPAYRLWPQTYDTEGFFAAVFEKRAPTRDRMPMERVRYQEDLVPRSRQREIAKLLTDMYGTSFMEEGESLWQRGEQIMLAGPDIEDYILPVQDYSLGLPFALRLRDGRIRLDHDVVTLRGHAATKSMLELKEEQLQKLFDGKDAECDQTLSGDIILTYRCATVGLGLAKNGILKNRLPRWLVQKS